MSRLFCFGLGYSAQALARALLGKGWRVAGTVRDAARAAALAREGLDAVVFDGGRAGPEVTVRLAAATHVLDSIPPAPGAPSPALARCAGTLVSAEELRWCGYLSTTGVYGDHRGGWVDETTPVGPSQERGARRVEAENAWLIMHERYGLAAHVFRLAGIYGPGRGVLEQVRAGRARRIVKPGQVFSRIHVDDIVTVLEASMGRPDPGAVYNVCDDEPESPARVVEFACGLLGVDPPPAVPFAEAGLSGMAASFYADSKRVSNRKIREVLGVELRHPTYREGLSALARLTSSPSVAPRNSRSRSRDRR